MVLEETLVIRGPIDSPEVLHAFREAGMPARITRTVTLEALLSAKGTIRNIKTLLKEEVERTEKLAEEYRAEEGIEEDEGAEPIELYDPFLEIAEQITGALTEFMDIYQPGDVVSADEIKEWMRPAAQEEEPPDAGRTMIHRLIAFTTLDGNDLVKIEDGRVTIQGHRDPEDLVITLPGEAIEDIDPEVIKEHGVLAEMIIISPAEYRLEFGPEAVLRAELEEVDELADDLDIDEDVYMSFREAISLKQVATTRTIEILEKHGLMTPQEVVEALRDDTAGGTEEGWSIMLDLTPEFVKGLLNDLRKIGLVRKKGGGFRAV